ncbi:MAG: hypothetical protein ACPGUD_01255 [Parashewanella sp.]
MLLDKCTLNAAVNIKFGGGAMTVYLEEAVHSVYGLSNEADKFLPSAVKKFLIVGKQYLVTQFEAGLEEFGDFFSYSGAGLEYQANLYLRRTH